MCLTGGLGGEERDPDTSKVRKQMFPHDEVQMATVLSSTSTRTWHHVVVLRGQGHTCLARVTNLFCLVFIVNLAQAGL